MAPFFELLKHNCSIIYCHILDTILLYILVPGMGGKRREKLITETSEILTVGSDLMMGAGGGWRKHRRVVLEAFTAERKQGQL